MSERSRRDGSFALWVCRPSVSEHGSEKTDWVYVHGRAHRGGNFHFAEPGAQISLQVHAFGRLHQKPLARLASQQRVESGRGAPYFDVFGRRRGLAQLPRNVADLFTVGT